MNKKPLNQSFTSGLKKRYYVRQEKLNTEDKTELGWLYGIHLNYCSRNYVTKIVNEMLLKKLEKMSKNSCPICGRKV